MLLVGVESETGQEKEVEEDKVVVLPWVFIGRSYDIIYDI